MWLVRKNGTRLGRIRIVESKGKMFPGENEGFPDNLSDERIIEVLETVATKGFFIYVGSFVLREGLSDKVLMAGVQLLEEKGVRFIEIGNLLKVKGGSLSEEVKEAAKGAFIRAIKKARGPDIASNEYKDGIHFLLNGEPELSHDVKIAMIKGMGERGADILIREVADFIQNERSDDILLTAIEAFAHNKKERYIQKLLDRKDVSGNVRKAAEDTLRQLRNPLQGDGVLSKLQRKNRDEAGKAPFLLKAQKPANHNKSPGLKR